MLKGVWPWPRPKISNSFHALKTLRYLANQSVNKIPVLIYTEVDPSPTPAQFQPPGGGAPGGAGAAGYQFTCPP